MVRVAFTGPAGAAQVEEISDDGQGSRARRRWDRRGTGSHQPGGTAGLAPVAHGLALAGRPDTAALDFRERPGRGGAAATGGDDRLPARRAVPAGYLRLPVGRGSRLAERGEPERVLAVPVAAAAVPLDHGSGGPAAPAGPLHRHAGVRTGPPLRAAGLGRHARGRPGAVR